MKIIFLDFDGVLNTEAWQRHCMAHGLPTEDGFGPVFDPEAIANLKAIVDAVPDIGIVITSSWKWEGEEKMKQLWQERGLPGHLAGIAPDYIPDLDDNAIDEILRGKRPVVRGADIRYWQELNNATECPYVIFDDIPDFFPEQQAHFIQTDPHVGITRENAKTTIDLLNRYVILSAAPSDDTRAIHVDPAKGLTRKDVELALELLNYADK